MSMRQLKISKSITNRDSLSLERYLQEIGREPLTSPEEEVELAVRIKKGDQQALERLTKANLRFVVSVAKQYQNQGLSLPDLINEGNLGLIKGAQRYDETKGFKFISYAVWWIRQTILNAIAEHSRLVRVPLNKLGISSQVSKAYQVLEQDLEREPTASEVAEFLNMSTEDVTASLNINSRHLSVDSPFSEEDSSTLIDVLVNDNAATTDDVLVNHESLNIEIGLTLSTLSERQKKVICFFYGIGVDHPLTLEDIGERFSITRERVRQIKEKAITKLRTAPRCKELKGFL